MLLHEVGMIHGDVRPVHVLLDRRTLCVGVKGGGVGCACFGLWCGRCGVVGCVLALACGGFDCWLVLVRVQVWGLIIRGCAQTTQNHRQAKLTNVRIAGLGGQQQQGQEGRAGADTEEEMEAALYLAPGACCVRVCVGACAVQKSILTTKLVPDSFDLITPPTTTTITTPQSAGRRRRDTRRPHPPPPAMCTHWPCCSGGSGPGSSPMRACASRVWNFGRRSARGEKKGEKGGGLMVMVVDFVWWSYCGPRGVVYEGGGKEGMHRPPCTCFHPPPSSLQQHHLLHHHHHHHHTGASAPPPPWHQWPGRRTAHRHPHPLLSCPRRLTPCSPRCGRRSRRPARAPRW
jgi:hypothetical protein